MHAFESGKRKVSIGEIRKLARLYQRPVGWLIGEAEAPNVQGTALYRAASELSEGDRAQVLRFAEFLAASSRENEER